MRLIKQIDNNDVTQQRLGTRHKGNSSILQQYMIQLIIIYWEITIIIFFLFFFSCLFAGSEVLRDYDEIVGPVEKVEQQKHQGEQPDRSTIKFCLEFI